MTAPGELPAYTLERTGDVPVRLTGTLLAVGTHTPDGEPIETAEAGTVVSIYRTGAGRLVAHLRQWRPGKTPRALVWASEPGDQDDQLDALLAWMREEGKGRIGHASLRAWSELCEVLGVEDSEDLD